MAGIPFTKEAINWLVCLLISPHWTASPLSAQSLFPMRYVDEVGHLGTEMDDRKSVDVGLARVFPDGNDLWFEGKDHSGKPWSVGLTKPGTVGFVDVWTADFDHNGQPDLLIAPFMPQNGRCASRIMIMILLFDSSGRPTAWGIDTQIPNTDIPSDPPYRPILIVDLNGDRRAEFATVSCKYAERPGQSTDWEITGVYQARDTRLVPMRKTNIVLYEHAVKEAYPHGPDEKWLPVRPDEWPEARSVPIENRGIDGRR